MSVEREDGLDGDVDAVELVGLEHHLDDLLPVLGGVHGGLGQQDLTVLGVDVQLLGAEGVVPQVLHVVPAPDDAVLHGVVHLQHGAQLAGLVAHHQVLTEVKGQEFRRITESGSFSSFTSRGADSDSKEKNSP